MKLDTTKRQMLLKEFALHAPVEIPIWFEREIDTSGLPPNPSIDDVPPELRKHVADWLESGCPENTLDIRLKTFEEATYARWKAEEILYTDAARHDYIAWRWHYAELMVAEMERRVAL